MSDAVALSSAGTAALARFYMTSDLRAATGLTRTHLDFYLREGLIVPTARTESGYLLFDDGELSTLRARSSPPASRANRSATSASGWDGSRWVTH